MFFFTKPVNYSFSFRISVFKNRKMGKLKTIQLTDAKKRTRNNSDNKEKFGSYFLKK